MKKVIDQTFGKNGDVLEVFTPTAKMIIYAICLAKNPLWTDAEVSRETGITPVSISRWRKYGSAFTEWLEEFLDQHAPDKEAELLEAVGMVNAIQGNYNFWKDMAKARGVIKEDSRSLTINLNTDFSHISLGDFDEQRARLLSELRGVGVSGKSRVAEPLTIEHQGSDKSSGDRVGEVQNGSLALANPLGSNRGRRRAGQPVPALSQQAASSDSDPLLATHAKAVMPKK